ncbi:serine/threonine-protein kinase drkB [Phytophthora cinnamomi]|uniref:serine/threonine-protein kinase drkB n=1 Tax=Phytophthora cinnamomi TaxID=4785 RepID=UPI00355A8565|nr:serine/threonine-protein kinase drkB [Phytophthora cinnamomi]
MQEFSEWMTTLQKLPQHSPASSYAETDSADSDSDDSGCTDCRCGLEPKRKLAAQRTAPISIPTSGRRQPHPHLCASVVESPDLSYHADMRLLRAGRYLHEHDDGVDSEQDELDEDDPAFYGNLAFFRSQCGAQPRVVRRSALPLKAAAAPTSPTGVDDGDEDIFAMEL